MTQPKAQPRIIKLVKYYLSAIDFFRIVRNWYVIPLGYLKLIDFSGGQILSLYNGLKFKVNHYMDSWAVKEVFGNNDYRLSPTTKPFTVIDIGANTGTFSVCAATMGKKVKVISIEPSRSTFETLRFNINVNGFSEQIFPINFAVYPVSTRLKLYDPGPSGMRSLFRTRNETRSESVPTITLAEVMKRYQIAHCDYLKIDCEGAEYDILTACPASVLQKISRISLEFHEIAPGQKHHTLIDILTKNGFKTFHEYNRIESNIGYIYAYK